MIVLPIVVYLICKNTNVQKLSCVISKVGTRFCITKAQCGGLCLFAK